MSANVDLDALADALETAFVLVYDRTHSIRDTMKAILPAFTPAKLSAAVRRTRHVKAGRHHPQAIARRAASAALGPLLSRVAAEFGMTIGHLRAPSQLRAISSVRNLAVWVARTADPARNSFPAIGQALGGRNHSTIMTAFRKAKALLRWDRILRARLQQIATAETTTGGSPACPAVAVRQSGAAPAGHGGERVGLATLPVAGGLAAGGQSASPAKLSRRAA